MMFHPFRALSTPAGKPWRLLTLTLALALGFAAGKHALQDVKASRRLPESLPAGEFSRMIQEFSEEGGYFHSDNFTSNETGYLTVVDKLRDLGATGGAYIGVGPEQNFTYIAKTHPRIAFIVDIRRQAMIQHLMYKAIFQHSEDRVHFLSLLLSRPLTGRDPPGRGASLDQIVNYFTKTPPSESAFVANLATIGKTIRDNFRVPLTAQDQTSLEYVYGAFRDDGLNLSFRMGYGHFPALKDLIEQPDPKGKPGNFLATDEDYSFVRDLQRRNRVIPVVGDFAGPKALKAVGAYLRKNSYSVNVFYTSNVEQFLFRGGFFSAFAENVRSLPITSESLFIRSVPNMWRQQPIRYQYPGARMTTMLQKMSVFLKDYDGGVYQDYRYLISTHYIPLD